jgi:hypothetical protein
MVLYDAGAHRSEVARLKVGDIGSLHMIILAVKVVMAHKRIFSDAATSMRCYSLVGVVAVMSVGRSGAALSDWCGHVEFAVNILRGERDA